MNSQTLPYNTMGNLGAEAALTQRDRGLPGYFRWLVNLLSGLWKYAAGAILCQGMLLSVLVVGWTARLMRRSALRHWYRRSELSRQPGMDFASFAAGDAATAPSQAWPGWVLGSQGWAGVSNAWSGRPSGGAAGGAGGGAAGGAGRGRIRAMFAATLGGLWTNSKIGFQMMLNTWLLTLPACCTMMFSWYAGWDNSFNKGYEQAFVGPSTGLLGAAMLVAVMLYLPFAQARQAVTGDWRAFYQFKLIRGLVVRHWFAMGMLAAFYMMLSLPVAVLSVALVFVGNQHPALLEATDQELLNFLNGYYFWSVVLAILPSYLMLRLVATRWYAGAVLHDVQRGRIEPEQLGAWERDALSRLNLLQARPQRERHILDRMISWTGTRLGRVGAITAAVLLLIGMVFLSYYIVQFFNYRPYSGWLNHPLIQLPWFRFIPAGLEP